MEMKPWGIGLFIIVGFGLTTAILFLIGDQEKAFGKHLTVYTEFTNLSGLPDGAKVRVSGLDAGEVKKIEIPKTPSGRFRVELQLEDKVRGMIREDSIASIQTQGVVGDQFVSIQKGTDTAGEVRNGSTLPSKEPVDLSALLEDGSGLLKEVHGDIGDIRARTDVVLDTVNRTFGHTDDLIVQSRPDLSAILGNGARISGTVDTLVTGLNEGRGTAGMILTDEDTKQKLRATVGDLHDASVNIDQASVRANQTMADFQSRDLPAKTQRTLDNVQSLSLQLNTAVQEALAQDDIGLDGATNLRQALSGLNRSTSNVAEDTEALKHNFFLRGFFKRRGFYNLDEITPTEYRAACEGQKNRGPRIWLPQSGVFVIAADGKEQLSDIGPDEINLAVAKFVDSLPGRIIIVEGYSTDGSIDQQFGVARRRADLVRRYLEMHYHLRHDDLGIVSLGNKPPQSSGEAVWNGAAIMLLK
jgi:phospholipid/cholesterol/gamma-HCH transport system substrate-binding protein